MSARRPTGRSTTSGSPAPTPPVAAGRTDPTGPGMTDAQRGRLLDLRERLRARGGEIVEIRELAGFVGATIRGSGLRRDGADVELLVLPDGSAAPGLVAVPTGRTVSWEEVEPALAAGGDGSQ